MPRPRPARVGGVDLIASPALPAGPIRELLIIKLDHIGDFLIAAPALAALRRGFAGSRITLLCGPWNVAVAERSGWFDRVVALRFFGASADAARPALDGAVLEGLGAFDLAIDLRVDEDTRAVLAAVRAARKIGYAAAGAEFLSLALARPSAEVHQRQSLMNLAGAALAQDFEGETAALMARVAEPVDGAGWRRPVIALATGSGRAIKNWPLERFVALARRLHAERGATVLLLGGAELEAHGAAMRAALPQGGVIDLIGKLPLSGSLAAMALADAYVGNDTALGHASAALGLPTLVLFSGIDPLANWAPLGPRAYALKTEVTCSPCHLSDLALCPNRHICMTHMTVDDVWGALSSVLGAAVIGA